MRAGRLNVLATIESDAGVVIDAVLIGISDSDDNIGLSLGLLSGARITVRARWHAALRSGCYLRAGNRLFVINDRSDPDGRMQDVLVSVSELRGVEAELSGKTVRCALLEYVAKPSRDSMMPAEERRRVEFCNAECRPVVGDEFVANGSRWRITEMDAEGSTPVVSRFWVLFLSHE